MDTTSSVVVAVIVTAVGQWAKPNGKISMKLVIGMMVLTMFLAALESSNEQLARKFALLILVSALFANIIPISKKLGFSK